MQSQLLADVMTNMATDEVLMSYLNEQDQACSTLTEYNSKANQIRAVMVANFEAVRQELEQRVGAEGAGECMRAARSRSPISTEVQSLRNASNQQLLLELARRMR
jgi:hypothetical protein